MTWGKEDHSITILSKLLVKPPTPHRYLSQPSSINASRDTVLEHFSTSEQRMGMEMEVSPVLFLSMDTRIAHER